MKNEYKNRMANKIAAHYVELEERIIQDIVRRIVKLERLQVPQIGRSID